jgi:hypothetical protein
MEGNEENQIALVTDMNNREDLELTEVSFGIPSLKPRIKFTKDKTIIFNDGLKNGGDFMVRFNELKSGFDKLKQDYNSFVTTTYNSHTHTETGSVTGTPTPTGTSSTASIDDAKITKIEVPEK